MSKAFSPRWNRAGPIDREDASVPIQVAIIRRAVPQGCWHRRPASLRPWPATNSNSARVSTLSCRTGGKPNNTDSALATPWRFPPASVVVADKAIGKRLKGKTR